MILHRKNVKERNNDEGFTLFELLVTMSVFLLLSTVVVANFRSVDNTLVLRNVANQAAVVIRKAQIQGISVKGFVTGTGEVFPSYGVNFAMSDNTTFALFADIPPLLGNGIFDGTCPSSAECVQRYTLARGYTIKQLCGNQKTGGPLATCALAFLDVTFTRPDPEALLLGNPGDIVFSDAEIVLQSRNGTTKTIVIWETGQITVE